MLQSQKNVQSFMTKAGQTVNERPATPSEADRIHHARMILEEATELITQGLGLCFNQEFSPTGMVWDVWATKTKPNILLTADGCADLGVVTDGCANSFGLDMEPIRAEVDRSNDTKFIDGHKDENGKWIKGPSYSPANLQPIIDAQLKGEPTTDVSYSG